MVILKVKTFVRKYVDKGKLTFYNNEERTFIRREHKYGFEVTKMVINGRKYVLVNKMRFFCFIFILVGTVFLIFFSSKVVGYTEHKSDETYIQYTVSGGDTLWDIAGRYSNHIEIRQYISYIMKVNKMDSANIYEGDILMIPVYR